MPLINESQHRGRQHRSAVPQESRPSGTLSSHVNSHDAGDRERLANKDTAQGGSLVVAEESDQSNACHAISHRCTLSQETLAGVYKWANSLLGHPLIQVLVWVVMALLPLVAGGRSRFRAESEAAVGFAGMQELPLEVFPDAEEELEEGSDSPWHGLFEPSVLVEDDQQPARWERSPRSPDTSDIQTKGARKKKKKKEKEEKKKKSSRGRHSSRDCRVEKREMRVRDLGMGFDSDEIVLFKFCVGSCQRSRGNYDLALRALLANGSLPKRTARKVSAHPCCRPTGYEPVSFMDATTTWRTIKSLSAADCECVG
ncbi:artemin-like [Sinocyclocheilus rhinocerous]|uniref:artemin-like n=1 Tax=Sinocyclocheilus rhinocerous TaxID=307959 RepID=UPI0007B9DDFE|nr:PREDICTED: artemin-like [Sinocyclocheilus rhinocerous]